MAFVSAPGFGRTTLRSASATSPRRTRFVTRAVVKPLGDRVIVRVDDAADQTAGGLFLGGEKEKEERTGTVVAVGPGRYSPEGQLEAIGLAPGDHVLWKDDYGSEKIEGDTSEGELLALKVFSISAKW